MRQIRDLPVDVAWELALHDTWRRANLADANLAGAYLVDANLAGAYLTHASLAGADLTGANLVCADLADANLAGVDLVRADLAGADLVRADLVRADLVRADLAGAYLTHASLAGADLTGANLVCADLAGADLTGANLAGANLTGAYLTHASLAGANLAGAYLSGVRGLAYQIPQEGELIVYKRTTGGTVKLRIPPEAKRTASIVGRKCRAEFAEVLEGEGDSTPDARGPSIHYAPGITVRPDSYDPDPRVQCSHGIHFYLTREECK